MRSEVSQEAWKKGCKRVSSADDWLLDTTQTARERSQSIIRSPEVRDRLGRRVTNWPMPCGAGGQAGAARCRAGRAQRCSGGHPGGPRRPAAHTGTHTRVAAQARRPFPRSPTGAVEAATACVASVWAGSVVQYVRRYERRRREHAGQQETAVCAS